MTINNIILPTLNVAIERFNSIGSECLDGRDASRLADFVPAERLHEIGLKLPEGADLYVPVEWTVENVYAQLAKDVDFAFNKAINRRGISASLMVDVLRMWHCILCPELVLPDYPQYGLPIIKAMALRFGLPNEIGDDEGNEYQYSSESDYQR